MLLLTLSCQTLLPLSLRCHAMFPMI